MYTCILTTLFLVNKKILIPLNLALSIITTLPVKSKTPETYRWITKLTGIASTIALVAFGKSMGNSMGDSMGNSLDSVASVFEQIPFYILFIPFFLS